MIHFSVKRTGASEAGLRSLARTLLGFRYSWPGGGDFPRCVSRSRMRCEKCSPLRASWRLRAVSSVHEIEVSLQRYPGLQHTIHQDEVEQANHILSRLVAEDR